eukprot:TRINITY_DN1326_c0_g2_i2.p1 TRINITY_DN1326_c0_g2~~TRINITY_DN1326_c0_g2_i2.p1  ORF type:complete len:439 (-),score=91.32 TRINITY_DN1326_c0_g2_i2:82-1398(-)
MADESSDEDLLAPGVTQAFGGGALQSAKGSRKGARGKGFGKDRAGPWTGYKGHAPSFQKIRTDQVNQRTSPYADDDSDQVGSAASGIALLAGDSSAVAPPEVPQHSLQPRPEQQSESLSTQMPPEGSPQNEPFATDSASLLDAGFNPSAEQLTEFSCPTDSCSRSHTSLGACQSAVEDAAMHPAQVPANDCASPGDTNPVVSVAVPPPAEFACSSSTDAGSNNLEKGMGKVFGKSSFKGKGRGKGKGKGKGKKDKGGSSLPDEDSLISTDPRRAIELAQRRAKQRDRFAINQAQREAQERFQSSILDRIQGYWVDESDPAVSYEVEGDLCTVFGGANSRTFRNWLAVHGSDLCWDAKRFWHKLNFQALPPSGEQVEKVEWNPGEGSPPTKQIIWLKAEKPPPVAEDEDKQEKAEGDEAASIPAGDSPDVAEPAAASAD